VFLELAKGLKRLSSHIKVRVKKNGGLLIASVPRGFQLDPGRGNFLVASIFPSVKKRLRNHE